MLPHIMIKKATLTIEKKLPIKGVQFSNKLSRVELTVELPEGVKPEDLHKELAPVWENMKYEVDRGLSDDRAEWLQLQKEEYNKQIAINAAIRRNMEKKKRGE